METGATVDDLQILGAPWANFYHSNGFPHTPTSPKPLPRQAQAAGTIIPDHFHRPSTSKGSLCK